MRLTPTQFTIFLCTVSLCFMFSGCGNPTEPQGPEMGSVQAYLDAHPEEREDQGDDAGSEEDEFGAAGTE